MLYDRAKEPRYNDRHFTTSAFQGDKGFCCPEVSFIAQETKWGSPLFSDVSPKNS